MKQVHGFKAFAAVLTLKLAFQILFNCVGQLQVALATIKRGFTYTIATTASFLTIGSFIPW